MAVVGWGQAWSGVVGCIGDGTYAVTITRKWRVEQRKLTRVAHCGHIWRHGWLRSRRRVGGTSSDAAPLH